jgi:hypothetical protein
MSCSCILSLLYESDSFVYEESLIIVVMCSHDKACMGLYSVYDEFGL